MNDNYTPVEKIIFTSAILIGLLLMVLATSGYADALPRPNNPAQMARCTDG